MTDSSPSLYLLTPPLADPAPFLPALDAALGAGGVVAVLVRLIPADDRTLVNRLKTLSAAIQRHDAAVIVADPDGKVDLATLAARGGADGAHAEDPARVAELRERLKEGRSIGAGALRTRHDAMEAGELGVDYVLFGEPRPDGFVPPLESTAERAEWWADIFQTPCVAYVPALDAVADLAGTGAEFLMLGDLVWTHPDGPAAAVKAVVAALAAREAVT
jgi:thiamine-phosphate pyrophosphorylase